MSDRSHPFALVFSGVADDRFPPIRAALGETPSLEAFLLAAPAIELLQALRPEEGLGDGGDDFVALVWAAYRYWSAGAATTTLDDRRTRMLCRAPDASAPRAARIAPPASRYIQVAPRLIWASLDGGTQHEPLDGWFLVPEGDALVVVALFGVHPERPGLSVVAVEGTRPALPVHRADGAASFAPTMAGGDVAGLHAIATADELLALAWRQAETGEEAT